MSTLTCTLIQTKLFWQDAAANRKMFEEKINSIKEKTEIIILPEMFSTGFSMQPEKFAETMDGETHCMDATYCIKQKNNSYGKLNDKRR